MMPTTLFELVPTAPREAADRDRRDRPWQLAGSKPSNVFAAQAFFAGTKTLNSLDNDGSQKWHAS